MIVLNSDVLFREYNEFLYLNNIRNHKILLLNTDSKELLDFFKSSREENEIYCFIKDYYCLNDDEVRNVYDEVIVPLLDDGVLLDDGETKAALSEGNDFGGDTIETLDYLHSYMENNHVLFSVTMELTYNCNLKCDHCYVSSQKRKEIETDKIKSILDELKDLNVASIVFTGGEVFTRKDAIEIIEYASQLGFMIDVFSNGTLVTEELFQRLLKCNLHSFQCSIYSSIPSVHDEFVKRDGSFEKTTALIKRFKECNVFTAIKTCIMNFNYKTFPELKEYANKIGVELQATINIMPKMNGNKKTMEYALNKYDAMNTVLDYLGDTHLDSFCKSDKLCSAGTTSLTIDPYGDIKMCSSLGIVLGNVYEESINEIWHKSPKLKQWLNLSKGDMSECVNCKYNSNCSRCPGIAYSICGNVLSCYDDAYQWAKLSYERRGDYEEV